jgi:hypothetical protein
MITVGSVLYVALLLINAMAVLSEDRFLARSWCPFRPHIHRLTAAIVVGWSTHQPQSTSAAFQQPYDQAGFAGAQGGELGVKARLINLISAVRTLMRGKLHPPTIFLGWVLKCYKTVPLIGLNIVVIIYELILGS